MTKRPMRMLANWERPVLLVLLVFLCALPAVASEADDATEWRSYARDLASTKYSPLEQINRETVKELEIVWRWSSPDNQLKEKQNNPRLRASRFEATPLMIDGVLYTSTSFSQVAAIDAAQGSTIWVHDPKSWEMGRPTNLGFVHRGVAYWSDGEEERIYIATGDSHLVSIDAKTGEPDPRFGKNGRIDLTEGLRRPVRRRIYTVSSPPVLIRDVVIVGSSIFDGPVRKEMPPGDVRGFDARTGELRWSFHTIPQAGEFGNETWEVGSWEYTGNANVWTLMSADEELGYVYLPVSTPTNDWYGGHRPGNNLFAESLVCLKAETGERVWHFQITHHGLWDYDLPAAPNLVDITLDGRRIKAVAQITKQGFTFVFDRATGEPVWPIEERPVPQSTVPGERTSPTQPFPTKPPPHERQGVTIDDLIDWTPELRKEAVEILEQYDYGPLYTPPSERGTIQLPGWGGGANWSGAAFDPETGILYVASITAPIPVKLAKPDPARSNFDYVRMMPIGIEGPRGLPLVKPPYARITAIDLNRGEHLWMRAIGDGPRDHELLKDLDLPPLGSRAWPFPLATKSLLFVGQGGFSRGRAEGGGGEAGFWALDKTTGEEIHEITLPASVTGAPMTYMVDGKQFIVVAVAGRAVPAELVAMALANLETSAPEPSTP